MKRKTSSQEARVSPPPLRRKMQSTTTSRCIRHVSRRDLLWTARGRLYTHANRRCRCCSYDILHTGITKATRENVMAGGRYYPTRGPLRGRRRSWRGTGASGGPSKDSGIRSRESGPMEWLRAPGQRRSDRSQDSTLIRTVSGKHFARDERDWQWWHPSVPGQVRDLHQKGCVPFSGLARPPPRSNASGCSYAVVILTNQGGINLQPGSKSAKADLRRLNIFKEKVAAVLGQLDIPITVYAATALDKYRKPRTGMWTQTEVDYKLLSSGALDRSGSFFVGDAGGRLGGQGSRDDHACSDR